MEPIKNALAQASNLVQQAAHTVAEALMGTEHEETNKDKVDKPKNDEDEKTEKNIDSKQIKFDREQKTTLEHSEIAASTGDYQDKPQQSDAKVLSTSWPDLVGKTRHEAEVLIKAKGYINVKVMKKGTSSSTEHDESRVILYVDDHDIIVEEPRVG